MHQQHSDTADIGFDALLEFVDECDLHQLDQQSPPSVTLPATDPSPSVLQTNQESCDNSISRTMAAPKQKIRSRRDIQELADLRSKVTALELRLTDVIQARQALAGGSTRDRIQLQPQIWKQEAEQQSGMRSAALRENACLKSMLQAQLQVAKSLLSSLRRNSSDQVRFFLQSPLYHHQNRLQPALHCC